MLEYLRVQNLAIIEDVELELASGLTVVTGETGAGKSILVGAIAALRGGRVSRDQVRDGADRALLEAILRPGAESGASGDSATSAESSPGAEVAGEPMTIVRTLSAAGRSRQRLDGLLVPASELTRRVAPLLDISGQHEGQSLTEQSTHLDLLDAYGVAPALRETLTRSLAEVDALAAERARLSLDEQERVARLDLLRYQLDELEAIRPEPGEEEALDAERKRLAGARELVQASLGAHALLYEDDGSVTDRLAQTARALGEVVAADVTLEEILSRVEEARALVEDVARDLHAYGESVSEDPERLAEAEDRLAELRRLGRKHSTDAAGLAALAEDFAMEIAELTGADERLDALGAQLEAARARAGEAARSLGRARRRAARKLAKAVEQNLNRLGMEGARFEVRVSDRAPRQGEAPERVIDGRFLSARGGERVAFYVAPNPGEEALPLARTASGGELSRVMLALKLVLADRDQVVTYVFDEVDAGIGGATADAVGLALAEVSRHRQVLCITHLAAIAAFADHHLQVGKHTRGGRTVTEILPLAGRARVEELARMLGGAKVTPKTRSAAEDLLERARTRVPPLALDAPRSAAPRSAAAAIVSPMDRSRDLAQPPCARVPDDAP